MSDRVLEWNVRFLMSERGMYKTTDLIEPLKKRGLVLSREQVYRLVTQPPERLNMEFLACVCDVLDCSPNDIFGARTPAGT